MLQERKNPHEAAATLVRRAKAGDRAAFGELVRRYRNRIFALALHLTGNESDADDIAQEVFWGAFQNLDQFAGRSEFFTWVYRIAVNKALNAKRNRNRRGETPLEEDPRLRKAVDVDAYGDPVLAAELRRTYARLLHALDRLPGEMRTTVVLVALQGLSHGEAAVVQSCSPGTIAWRIHKARAHLRKALLNSRPPPIPLDARKRAPTPYEIPISDELDRLLQEWGLPAPALA